MTVDSFKFLPRIIAFYYKNSAQQSNLPIPWNPIPKPVSDCRFGLVTSGGIYDKSQALPFDVEREKREPTWGDPTYRKIPVDIDPGDVGVSHLHINTEEILSDINILLPVNRFLELASEKIIGSIAPTAYSFMGYQGFPPNSTEWALEYGPKVAEDFIGEGVDCVFLTPA